MKLHLKITTIWGACWSGDEWMLSRTIRVLKYCQHIIDAADWILFSCVDRYTDGLRTIRIPKLDWQRWNVFVIRDAPRAIKTEFSMCVHEDGFPIEPQLWSPEFQKYDYIGAPWSCWGPELVVGNGGFFMQSRKIMELCMMKGETEEMHTTPSDVYVCRTQRRYFEDCGARFAPPELAAKFSTEQTHKDKPSFGFHGRIDSPRKYTQGWNQIAHFEYLERLKLHA